MTYTPTLFVENSAPGLSAAELNKLGAGIETASTTADAALTSAQTAQALAATTGQAYIGLYRRVRTADAPPVYGFLPHLDDVLTVSLPNVPSTIFRVTANLFYTADLAAQAIVQLAVSNNQPSRDDVALGGISAYGYVESPVDANAISDALAWDASNASFATLDGGSLAATLTAVVVNGPATGTVTIGVAIAEDFGSSSTGVVLLAGSYLLVERVF